MDITRENYESWFVDYLEGNLDENLVDTFIEFLQNNPDLKEELKLFESVTAVSEDVTFQAKNKLYKSKFDLEDEFNTAAVAEMEGDLNADEKASFENYLSDHPEKQKEKQLFEKTVLLADENIRFEKKELLYKKQGRKVFLLWAGRVAAILILALAIFSLIDKNPDVPAIQNKLAQVEEKSEQKAEPKDKTETEVPVQPEKELVAKIPASAKTETKVQPKKEIIPIPAKTSHENVAEILAMERIPLQVPKTIHSLTASLDLPSPFTEMEVMTLVYVDEMPDDEHLLTDNLRGKISLRKITRAGLNLVANISNDRFNYETDEEGKVTEYNYESRLLAFSIPSAHPTDGE